MFDVALGTPILGARSKERFLAIQRRNNMTGGGENFDGDNYRSNGNPGMQTLGAKNEFVRNNRQRSTLDTKRPSKGPAPTPPQVSTGQYGIHNSSYKNESDDEQMNMTMSNSNRNAINMSMYGSTPKNGSNPRRNRDDLNNSEV